MHFLNWLHGFYYFLYPQLVCTLLLKNLKQALEWATKAVELKGEEAFWVLRMKSLIQAELGDFKGAIETAKRALASAEKAGNKTSIEMNKASLEEWSKKK